MRQPPGPGDPTTVGRFRIVGFLGSGGMGRVLLGEDPDGRPAAIKLVHAELVDDGGFRARFRREVQLAAQAPPGWTAPFLDADPDAPRPWLATAYLDAPSLLEHLADRGPYRPDEAAGLGAGLAAALSALHTAGLVHRDLKPSNVLLTDGGPRLIDFGISRAVDGTALTATGQSVGTPEYMSPEQVVGAEAGPPSDVFSLGSLLVFAVRERTPFAAGSPTGALYRVVHDEPDLPPDLGPLLPVLRSCLAKDPAHRPTAPQVHGAMAAPADEPTVRTGAAGPGDADGTRPFDAGGHTGYDTPDRRRADGPRAGGPGAGGPDTLWSRPPGGWAPPLPTRYDPPPPPPGRSASGGSASGRRRTILLAAGAAVLAVLLGVGGTLAVLALRPDAGSGSGTPAASASSNPGLAPTGSAGTAPAPTSAPPDLAAGVSLVDTTQDVRYGDPSDRLAFASPTGNIACSLSPFEVRCDVVERTWQIPPRPSTCQQAFGTGAQLAGAAPAELTCVGDTLADPGLPALDYGRGLRTTEVTCVSRTDGVECRNSATGHGFVVSRATYRLY